MSERYENYYVDANGEVTGVWNREVDQYEEDYPGEAQVQVVGIDDYVVKDSDLPTATLMIADRSFPSWDVEGREYGWWADDIERLEETIRDLIAILREMKVQAQRSNESFVQMVEALNKTGLNDPEHVAEEMQKAGLKIVKEAN